MVVYNYTRVKRRDKRVYSLFNTTVSKSGWSVNTLIISGLLLAIFGVFGIIFCIITKMNWYSPFSIAKSSLVGYFYLVFVFAPIGIGITLNSYKIQGYKSIDFLIMYFSPKKALNQNGKIIKLTGYNMNTFVEKYK